MKQIFFEDVTIQNFLSVGHDPVKVEFNCGFNIIKGSNKIAAFDLEGNFNPAFLNSFELLTKKNNKSSKVIFVSKEGDISSILANGFVERLGYKNMFSLRGGIKEWILLELPLKK